MLEKIFNDQVLKYPQNIAVKTADEQLTFSDLNKCANQIARKIIEESKKTDEKKLPISVALLFEQGIDMIVGMVGALKTGYIYLPLDPSYPESRLTNMLDHADANFIITNNKNINLAEEVAFQSNHSVYILNIDQIDESISSENLNQMISKDQSAYILYTSGSTGKPKGVMQNHQNIWYFVQNYTKNLSIKATDRLTLFSAFSHDAAVMDIYSGLLNGATLYPLNIKDQVYISEISAWLQKEKITIWHSVPTVYRYFVKSLAPTDLFPDLRFVVLGGERVLEHDVTHFKKIFSKTILVNLYGQSESSYNSSQIIQVNKEFKKVTLGEPVNGTKLLVVTDTGKLASPLSVGEIVIASEHVALGYWKDPLKTEAVFKTHPDLGKLYRTGDLGRLLINGEIEYIGRKDFQVKVRGYRIELGEIESHILNCSGVKEGAVILKGDVESNQNLCAFIVTDKNLTIADIRGYLELYLPDYMIPTNFIFLDQLPLTPSNKVDRKALLEIKFNASSSGVEYQQPTNETEKELVKIWTELLGEIQIGITDNFFRIGGNSLLATQLASRIFKKFEVEVPLREIFNSSTVQELARYIEKSEKSNYYEITPIEKRDHYPLSSSQKRLYLLSQLDEIDTSYNISGAIMIKGRLDEKRLETAFRNLIKRHDILRTSFDMVNGEPVQIIHNDVDFSIFNEKECQEAEAQRITKEFIQPFDLSLAPLLRVKLIEFVSEKNKYLLVYDLHHIIADGTSMLILINEMLKLYAGDNLPNLKIEYKDYAIWQNKFFQSDVMQKQEEFWLNTFQGQVPLLNMPLDFKRPEIKTFTGHQISFKINRDIVDGLKNLVEQQNSTLNMVLLSIYALLLNQYTAQNDLVIGSLVAGRNHPDLDDVIGMFANYLPVRMKVNPENTFREFIDYANKIILKTYENQDYPFELIVDKVKINTPRARNPLFDTMLILHNENIFSEQIVIAELEFAPYRLEHKTATLDCKLDFYLGELGELSCFLEYNTALFRAETMLKFTEDYQKILAMAINSPGQKISEIKIFSKEEQNHLQRKRELHGLFNKDVIPFVITSTFTSEPIAEYLIWWCQQFELKIELKFAAYNQVFQELLDPTSLVSTNSGANILLVRFEDWIRNEGQANDRVLCQKLEANFDQLIKILRQKNKNTPYFVGIFPVSTHLGLSEVVSSYIAALNLRWEMALSAMKDVYQINFTNLKEMYNIAHVFDAQKDEIGHLPFSDHYYAAMGTFIARKIYSWQKQHFKVIVLDCDNTLWRGVCGENGTFGVKLDAPYIELQKFMLQKHDEGMLLVLCSKNNEPDVWDVFERNPEMILQKEHLANWKINWQTKSENMLALAQELNLGLDSFIFIDDNPVECSEVMTHCPEVLTLLLPKDELQIPAFLQHVWAFDRFKITEEDKKRTQMYLAERQRQQVQKEGLNLDDYLHGLGLKMSMNLMKKVNLARVSQLTQRTNQFNLSTIRRSEEEIENLLKDDRTKCWIIQVVDRFGDYGIVGVVITIRGKEELFVDTMLLSCRVLGRRVEDTILIGLKKYCQEYNLSQISANFYPTAKNTPFREFLKRTGWRQDQETVDYHQYSLLVETIPQTNDFIELVFKSDCIPDIEPESFDQIAVANEMTISMSMSTDQVGKNSSFTSDKSWQVLIVNEKNLVHKKHFLPVKNCSSALLVKLPINYNEQQLVRASFFAPRDVVEEKLVRIWSEILGVGKIGIRDNFFALGGQSLKATSLIANIYQEFSVQLSLRDIFRDPTIEKIAEHIRSADKSSLTIPIFEEKDYYPVSSAQKRLFLLNKIEGLTTSYNMPGALKIEGEINYEFFQSIFEDLIKRHDSLRTSFELINEEIIQRVNQIVDFEVIFAQATQDQINQEIQKFIRPFDLSQAPLLRVELIKCQDYHVLVFDMHHIISDGISLSILVRDFVNLYNNKRLPELRIQYKDFAIWQNELFKSEKFRKQENYWLGVFKDEIPLLNISTDYSRPPVMSHKGEQITFYLDRELTSKLIKFGKQMNTTLFMNLLAVYYVLLSKYSGQEDIVIGTPIVGRQYADLQNMIGMFVNTLVLRNLPQGEKTFIEFLEEVKENTSLAYDNQDYQFEMLVEKLELKRDLSRNPIFDTMFTLLNLTNSSEIFSIEDLRFTPYKFEQKASKFDLSLTALEADKRIVFNLEYCIKLFKKATVEQLSKHLLNLIKNVLENPQIKISEIPMVLKEEEELVACFNATQTDYLIGKTVDQLLVEQAEKSPQQIAVIFEEQQITYEELNKKTNHLARMLRKKGVQPDQIIGLMVDRSIEMIIGMIAILKSGAAYLPIDPDFPKERIKYMLNDSKASILLSMPQLIKDVESQTELIDLTDIELYQEVSSNLQDITNAQNLAYVIYTSGSTGKPKGVMIEHRAIHNFINGIIKQINFTANKTILSLTTISFDIFVLETLLPLSRGLKVIIANQDEQRLPESFNQVLLRHSVDILQTTPSRMRLLISDKDNLEGLQKLKEILIGGESFPKILLERLKSLTKARIYNMYGPTETTVWSTIKDLTEEEEITIGQPIANTKVHILDQYNHLAPINVAGELCVSGDGLARGYLNRAELTAEKFAVDDQGQRIYRTGDWARWLADGNLQHLGRIDNQVKIRGYRIELGEIEARLLEHEAIEEVAVIDNTDSDENKYLCAYLVVREKITENLQRFLAKELPEYMIPAHFIEIEKFPVTPNGKLNRSALPKVDGTINSGKEYVPPTNTIEERLAKLWSEILGIKKIGIEDSFFELGGHSLKATSLASRISKEFSVALPLRQIFKTPTIKGIGEYISRVDKKAYSLITTAKEREYYPVSSAQKRLFVLNQLDAMSTAYNMPLFMRIEGELDQEAFERAFQDLIQRHEALRTSFELVAGEPVQRIHSDIGFRVSNRKVQGLNWQANQTKDLIREFTKPFDLEKAPLLRVELVELGEKKYLMMFDMHHIISDGVSLNILVKELFNLYQGNELPRLRIQYKDFAVWQEDVFASKEFKVQEEYWLQSFRDQEIPLLNLPTDYIRPGVLSFAGERIKFKIDQGLTDRLHKLAVEQNATMFMVLLAAYNILLAKYANQEDILIGSPIAGRHHADLEPLIGVLINTLVLRNYPKSEKNFTQFLKEVKENAIIAYENQDYPFERLVDNLDLPRDLSRNPLFNVMFVMHTVMTDQLSLKNIEIPGLTFRKQSFESNVVKFDLHLNAQEISKEIWLVLEYSTTLYRKETVERMSRHFLQLLNKITINPESMIRDLDLVSKGERERLLVEFNDTKAEYPRDKTIDQLFAERVKTNGEQIAVIFEEQQISYVELNRRANQLARVLRKKGVQSGQIIGLMVERSLEMITGILGIIKAGGAYMPILPDYPRERIMFLLKDSKANLLLTQKRWLPEEQIVFAGEIIDLEAERLYLGDGSNLAQISKPKDLIYVIYTSGSTGKPKGVMIEHWTLINRLHWMGKICPLKRDDTFLQKTPFTFDVSVQELFYWMLAGGKMCFLVPGGEKEPEKIIACIEKQQITVLHFVPSMLGVFLDHLENGVNLERLASLKQVLASGEALQVQHVKKFAEYLSKPFGIKLHNLYGPTEATIDVTHFDCSRYGAKTSVPIGRPIDNIRIYVVDQNDKLQPIGIPGELCIAGDALARGYLNRADLTAEKFVVNPFETGERMYRTGDLARWLPTGDIEFLGRIDYQVKIRGFRIEPGEIEQRLLKHAEITEVVVVPRDNEDGNKYLCAYLVSQERFNVTDLREWIGQELPTYMIPTHFVQLEKMPLTPNGKLNRQALPEPDDRVQTGKKYVAPTNMIEERLEKLWSDVLHIEKVGIDENFFELGGHSLKATYLISRIYKELHMTVPLSQIFKTPTIRLLAEFIAKRETSIYSTIEPVEERKYYPVSSAQKRLFVLKQFDDNSITYNVPNVLYIEGELDRSHLENAFKKLISRHESLRTSFELIDGVAKQRIHSVVDFKLSYREATTDEVDKIVAEFIKPFDLSKAPLFRLGITKLSEKLHLLIMDTHHIIFDGTSIGIFVKELVHLYQGQNLAELRIQYKDFAVWQNKLFNSELIQRQKEYWLNVFADEIPVLNMPTDYPRPKIKSYQGNRYHFVLDEELTAKINEQASAHGMTLYMILLAAFNILLAKYSGQADIIIGTPIAGRTHVELENIIGMFANTLAFRNYPDDKKTIAQFLLEVKKRALRAYENQDYQFEMLLDQLDLERDISRNPLFDAMLVLLNQDVSPIVIDDLKFIPYGLENKTAKFDLVLHAIENVERKIHLTLEYCADLFHQKTIKRMAGHFSKIIDIMVQTPQLKLKEVEMITEEEREKLLYGFNHTQTDYPSDKTIHQLFTEQVKKTPNQTAVFFEDDFLTYGELNQKANQLAQKLRIEGVQTDSIVGIMVERSLDLVIGMLGILKAGGAYLPIDPGYPQERIEYMLEDSQTEILLVQNHLQARFDFVGKKIDLLDEQIYSGDLTELNNVNTTHDLVYVIYTSGSTGKPKGVMIEHRNVVNLIQYQYAETNVDYSTRVLQFASMSFDVSFQEIFSTLLAGGELYLINQNLRNEINQLLQFISEKQIEILFLPVSFVKFVFGEDEFIKKIPHCIKHIITAGEQLTVQDRFRSYLKENRVFLHNHYGPSETHVVTTLTMNPDENIPELPSIGRPISNTQIYIVDQNNRLQPIGVGGELCIAGENVGRGYLKQRELTDERFVRQLFGIRNSQRIYRTGDLARWLWDGRLEFLGRIDQQVKINGFRVELGEIENQLLNHPEIKEAVVIDREDNNTKYLCAYIVSREELSVVELRKYLSKKLPRYMIPGYFVSVDKIPLTPNRKVDRRSLPLPDGSIKTGMEFEKPRNEIETQLRQLWASALQMEVEKISIYDAFFDLGGNSLKLIKLNSLINQELGFNLKITDLFNHNTIEQIAALLGEPNDDKEILKITF